MHRVGWAGPATASALAGTLALTMPAMGQDPAAFYQGKTIAIVMGTGPGGSYDLYGRVIATHLTRHIPGNPNIIIEHMPGAGARLRATSSTDRRRRMAPSFCFRTPCR